MFLTQTFFTLENTVSPEFLWLLSIDFFTGDNAYASCHYYCRLLYFLCFMQIMRLVLIRFVVSISDRFVWAKFVSNMFVALFRVLLLTVAVV